MSEEVTSQASFKLMELAVLVFEFQSAGLVALTLSDSLRLLRTSEHKRNALQNV